MSLSGKTQSKPQRPHLKRVRQTGYAALLASLALAGCQGTPEPGQPLVVAVGAAQIKMPAESLVSVNTPDQIKRPGKPHKSNFSYADSSWLRTIQTDFNTARDLVEQELQVDLDAIKLYVVDDTPINEEVALETRRLVQKQFGTSDFASHFLDQIMHPLAGTYAALYSSRLSAVMISRDMLASYQSSLNASYDEPARRAALLTLLIHELVHAADDKRYGIHDNRALNFRASFAQSATFEGHAQWVTRRICEKALCSEGLKALDDFMFGVDHQPNPQLTPQVEAINRSVLEYSYIEGERFIERLAQRDNGAQLIDELLRNPPLDPIQILAPENFPDNARENRNQQLIRAGRNVSHPWATAPWIGVETSPLKGVDLRSDPSRRQAAVDGFTRLIQGMVSMQFYNQRAPDASPIEATLLQTESANTARLFASTLHANTQHADARINDEALRIREDHQQSGDGLDLHIYRTEVDAEAPFRTAVAVAGLHVVQVSGSNIKQSLLDDYAVSVLRNLNNPDLMALNGESL